ncbi:MAG: 1-acyl-sn-glycerol-3-phosphate acyltransferase [Solirubrobacterales bacterium]
MSEPPKQTATRKPRVALVLGGGGARGYAHIGVVQVLEEADVEVVAIAGSSMGALVGGLFAAGKLQEFTDWSLGLNRFKVLRLFDVSLSSPGTIRGERVFGVISEMLEDRVIEDLLIDYTAVAVDLLAYRELWFREGPLDIAIRASSAMPSLFAPVALNGRLVGGGVLNPVPVVATGGSSADCTIAVSLYGRARDRRWNRQPRAEDWSDKLGGPAGRWFDDHLHAAVRSRLRPKIEEPRADSETRSVDSAAEAQVENLRRIEVMETSLDAMRSALTRHRLAAYQPDYLISVPRNAARVLEFHQAEEMIKPGAPAGRGGPRRLDQPAMSVRLHRRPVGDEVPPRGGWRVYQALRIAFRWLRWWVRLDAQGLERLPSHGPVLVAANHDSWLDPLAIAEVMMWRGRAVRFLARSNLWRWPIVGWVLGSIRQIPIRRGARDTAALDGAVTALRRGEAVGIFPEGTYSRGQALRAHRGVARLAHRSPGVPIVLAAVAGGTELRRFPRRPRITVDFFYPAGGQPRPEEPDDELAERLLREIRARVPPTA